MPVRFARFRDALTWVAGRAREPDNELSGSPLVQLVAFLWQKSPEDIANRVKWIRQALGAEQWPGISPAQRETMHQATTAVVERATKKPSTPSRSGRRRRTPKPEI